MIRRTGVDCEKKMLVILLRPGKQQHQAAADKKPQYREHGAEAKQETVPVFLRQVVLQDHTYQKRNRHQGCIADDAIP